ncbi:putative spindle pole body-associated protein [Pseudozyma hubeiensis]|nr:putative spindle pole body-associated protein [Pseudozyma hubeiensis]
MNGFNHDRNDMGHLGTPRFDGSSSLGQLRQNLREARLRESMHRPAYPSPLSQSPMQASISSASRTAASIASSSRSTVSTSTTPPSASSRFSINQAFKTLTNEDIDFFDRLVASLPSQTADFSQLKTAYTAQLPSELDLRYRSVNTSRGAAQVDWDAHLWSILLSLVKVRGRNWRERWDSVRLAFGLDPNSGDETDLSAVTQSSSRSATGSSTQHGDDWNSEDGWDDPHPRAERKSADPTLAHTPRQSRERRSVLASRYNLGLPRSSSPLPQQQASPYPYRLLHDELAQEDEALRAHPPTEDPISAIQLRLRRMIESHQQGGHVGSSDCPDYSLYNGYDGREAGTQTDAFRLPTDAKRRFDELVRSSQSARATLRQSRGVQQERHEQQAADNLQEMAELWRARRLLQTCLAWWITLTRKQLEMSQNAADASARVTMQKAWERWRAQDEQDLQGRRVGEKTDRWRSRLRSQRAEIKEAAHNRRLVEQVFEIWRSKAAKQQRLAALLRSSLAQSNEKLARAYLQQWVAKIIEVRNRELEVKEQRQRRLLKAALYAWIEACLRHDDLLALMNSYVDVKEEEKKRQTFACWLAFAREQKERREKVEASETSTRKRMLATSWNNWRDKLKERALATQEYHMLLRRQQLSQRWVLEAWKAQTLLLPAIRMRNASLKRNALQRWQQRLPAAQMSNHATKMIRERLMRQYWHRWKDNVKATRQFRAAARFGAGSISAHRLRSLASAANRSMGSSSPSAAHSSSPYRANAAASSSPGLAMSATRPKTSLSLRPPSHAIAEDMTPRPGRSGEREPSFFRRGTSVPRHLEASFAAGSADSSAFLHDDATPLMDTESPSKEAGSRRARTASVVAAATPTSISVSDHSRFSLALKSSTSSVSAVHAPRNGINSATKSSRRQSHVADIGPTLSSAAQRNKSNQREPSDTDSDSARRIKRSAKYEQPGPLARSQRADSIAPASNDGFESGNSVQSAPVVAVERSSTTRHSPAVAEDMILQLRAKVGSRHRRPV